MQLGANVILTALQATTADATGVTALPRERFDECLLKVTKLFATASGNANSEAMAEAATIVPEGHPGATAQAMSAGRGGVTDG